MPTSDDGRDAVGEGVEGDVGEEAAPLRRRPAPGVLERVAVVVEVGVPPVGGHLGDRVDAGDHVGPEGGRRRGRRGRRRPCRRWRRRAGRAAAASAASAASSRPSADDPVGEEGGGPVGDLGVERGDGGDVVPQGGDLADHVHPVPLLVGLVDRRQPAPVPLEALGRDPQPAQVELLQLGPHLLRRRARRRQPPAGLVEGVDVGRRGAAGGVAGRGLQQHRLPALDRLAAGSRGGWRPRPPPPR